MIAPRSAGPQTSTLRDDVVITLERRACGGPCPIYSVFSGKSALECAKDLKEVHAISKPSVLDGKPLFVRDFDRIIILLEDALANRRRK